ncbi:MAG: LD-carboxypeptidase [Muribaculaceae bacterium]|nr:LD-carboxypeptidase [Muribaculaceae bacterium]
MMTNFVTPPLLREGDLIAILAPASAVDAQLVNGASEALRARGFRVEIFPTASGRSGTYSGTLDARLNDFSSALADADVKAILCARGGYGCVHLLTHLKPRPVWLIGFSDVSALHALWLRSGIRSIHGSMAKELALARCPGDEANSRLFELLRTGSFAPLFWDPSPLNRLGEAGGILMGGNLAVLDGLISTPYNIIGEPGSILFIEDVAEPVYKVERMLYRLRLNGAFERIAGLIVGQFTDYKPDSNGEPMEEMIARMTADYSFPIAFGAPIGHVDRNLPLLQGARVTLSVTPAQAALRLADE